MLNEVYYAPPSDLRGDHIILSHDERRHLVTVVRHRPGDVITIVDGLGSVYTAAIGQIGKDTVQCHIHSREQQTRPVRIVLGVGLLKNPSRFDFLVEKSTELGVAEIVPLATARTIATRGKSEHWAKLALAAMKQSGRAYLPTIAPVVSFGDFVRARRGDELALLAHEKSSGSSLHELLRAGAHTAIRIAIGPEGGFNESEVAGALEAGWREASLGEYRLRTETAAVAAVAEVSAYLGDAKNVT